MSDVSYTSTQNVRYASTQISINESREIMSNIDRLINHYTTNYVRKLFYSKLTLENKNYAIMYTHEQASEVQNFIDNFTRYFPFYVWNEDQLEICKFDNIDGELDRLSKICWNDNVIIPQRETKVNGIYGETLLDFYERIVMKNKLVCTFASKRSFSSNSETTGFDNVLYSIDDNGIELIFSEAKFVQSCSSAKRSLIDDIKNTDGKRGHLTKEFLNDYMCFIVQKGAFFNEEEKEEIKPFFNELNAILISGGKDFVQFLVERNIKINCVFFAIFQSSKTTPIDLIDHYDSIKAVAEEHLATLNISNYSIEIIFVPTFKTSMEIKGAIDGNYTS